MDKTTQAGGAGDGGMYLPVAEIDRRCDVIGYRHKYVIKKVRDKNQESPAGKTRFVYLVVTEVDHSLRVREAALELVSPLLVHVSQSAAHLLEGLATDRKYARTR